MISVRMLSVGPEAGAGGAAALIERELQQVDAAVQQQQQGALL